MYRCFPGCSQTCGVEMLIRGGGGPSDMAFAHSIEVANTLRVNDSEVARKWERTYYAISRANNALARIHKLSEEEYPKKQIRAAEMRFVRSHHYFELKRLFKHIVWIDENMTDDEILETSNWQYTDLELWDKIIEDFRYAAEHLPVFNEDIGRANTSSAKAYLAKALLYAAYEQDEKHNVIQINKEKLQEVVSLVDQLEGHYELVADYADNFRWETENGPESVFAIQSSQDDDTDFGRLNMTSALSYPMADGYGCCGMHIPSQELVNAFKTDPETGLPLFDSFNRVGDDILYAEDLYGRTIDPRLLHTVAIVGLPYKYKAGHMVDMTFPREGGIYYGPFLSIKETVVYDCPCFKQARWYYASSLNRDIIRYDDALLWKAEALIELGGAANLSEARQIINRIRERAAQSTALLIDADGKPLADANIFKVGLYEQEFSSQEEARKALRWERRLEMAMESSRGYDLVRWGIAAETLNAYYATESVRREHLRTAHFTKNKDEYFPIPYKEINFSRGLYKQNPGWE